MDQIMEGHYILLPVLCEPNHWPSHGCNLCHNLAHFKQTQNWSQMLWFWHASVGSKWDILMRMWAGESNSTPHYYQTPLMTWRLLVQSVFVGWANL